MKGGAGFGVGLGWVEAEEEEGGGGGEIVKELRYEFSDNSIAPHTRLLPRHWKTLEG